MGLDGLDKNYFATLFILHLNALHISNFKNIKAFSNPDLGKIVAITGANGIGKTNLLDAIHYLCLTKSYFNAIDTQNIAFDANFFAIEGEFSTNTGDKTVFCGYQQRKVVKTNGVEYDRLANHIGFFPVVMVAPIDVMLILEGSETRRRFVDVVLSQVDGLYLKNLSGYNAILNNRNAVLKQSHSQSIDYKLINVYNEQLNHYGMQIFEQRIHFFEQFLPLFQSHYQTISGGSEQVSIIYHSQLMHLNLLELLNQNWEQDRAAQRTNVGIHKDDLAFLIGEKPLKKFGSQGQQKSFLIALKLAQYDFLYQKLNRKPLLLLDDIFEKLDYKRLSHLLKLVSDNHFGQIFLTDTQRTRVEQIFNQFENEVCYLEMV